MGTPSIALPVLYRLAGENTIVAVYTRQDAPAGRGRELSMSPVKRAAEELELEVFQPKSFRQEGVIDGFRELQPDAAVVAAYGKILPAELLKIPPLGCINVHFSLLPAYRGASPVAGAIIGGDKFTGISVMLMDPGMDTGPVLAQSSIPVFDHDNTLTLGERLSRLAPGMISEVLPAWASGEIQPRPQDNSRATYSGIIEKEAGRIDWSEPAVRIWRKSRAYYPWPGIFTTWQGRTVKILEAVPVALEITGELGRVIEVENGGVKAGIVTGEGVLGLKTLQLEGKKAVSTSEFLRGYRNFTGTVLPT